MKKTFFLVLSSLLLHSLSHATIRRVGFFGIPVGGVDYSNYALAYTACAAGDTIMVFPGIPAINQTFTKKIITIGPGSRLDPTATPKGNANMQAFAGTVSISSLSFTTGSDGSQVMGLEGGSIYIGASNIIIRRNRELYVYVAGANPATSVSNIQILENYRVIVTNYYTNASTVTGMNVSNNLITYFYTGTGNTYNGNISNNVFAYDATLTAPANGGVSAMSQPSALELGGGAYLFQNNILVSYTNASAPSNFNYFTFTNGANTVANYNMALQSSVAENWPTGTGNITTSIANAANIFDGFPAISTFSADARYALKAGSPALTAGNGGTPIGMFTGNTPYKLSMIPAVPSIYQLSSPQGNNPPGNTIQINVSTRGNN